jgi:hypothetical protein
MTPREGSLQYGKKVPRKVYSFPGLISKKAAAAKQVKGRPKKQYGNNS